ncbi:hypothetical protein ASG43_07100 [Aureimonas sp. Leaf454]|uniref:polysaccharide pyruvyl transferase family protein n=1 Tax=Aureimonas sp. Leaf454 TaxID=1736381 RepID=UPI0006FB6A96|nr:polysaccharide pyruvyl transferase family protein [Aureimonas sp. Leaf454]KQT51003.1 hypothetical protein ASG43_07100 [Aureimonas sp. Leaf454]
MSNDTDAANAGHAGRHVSAAVIDELKSMIFSGLDDLVDQEDFALLDFPGHPNVGDSAIWLGEVAYFRERQSKSPAYVCALNSYSADKLRERVPNGILYLHGGGNFGDIWESHHSFREMILNTTKGRRIVQLPQSIHFSSTARLDQMARLIEAHGQFTLLVRDQYSLDLAQQKFLCETRLVPDMAFCLGPLSPSAPSIDVMALLRTDVEKIERAVVARDGVAFEDWLDENLTSVRFSKLLGMMTSTIVAGPASAELGKFNAGANNRLRRGLRQLSRGRTVVTDRLHAHILSVLLGRPHAVLDNSYGKISRFMAAFSGRSQLARSFVSLDEALSWAKKEASDKKPE